MNICHLARTKEDPEMNHTPPTDRRGLSEECGASPTTQVHCESKPVSFYPILLQNVFLKTGNKIMYKS